ncbi:MAG: TetR/AcrR family transcriptional regulator [Candidatus Hydrogenedentota bacterium]
MAKRKLKTEVRQEQILEAALEIVSRKGMKGLNLGAVARRVGIVPSALYRHFENKEQMIDALLDLTEERLLSNVAAVREETSRPLAALEMLLMRHIRLIRENAGIPLLVFSEEVYGTNSERRDRVFRFLQRYLDSVAKFFAEAQDAGMVRTDISPDELSVMFLGLVQPPAILWHVSDGGFDVTRQAGKAWLVFSEAIAHGRVKERTKPELPGRFS